MSGNTQFRQDMPPPGGYRDFNFARTFPKVVWRPGVVVAVLFGTAVYGTFEAIAKKKALVNRELEEEIMKDVPGWKTGTWYGEPVYFTLGEKWWDPTNYEVFAHSDKHVLDKEKLWAHHSEYSGPKFYDKWIPKSIGKYIW